MARPQAGVARPPQKYGLSIIYQVKDVPMHAMSIAHLGAMIPGLAAETGEANSSVKANYLVGFGSLLGSFIWQGNQPRGYSSLDFLKKDESFQPITDGDLWIFFSSQSTEINHKLEECVQSYLSKIIIKKELTEGEMADTPYTSEPRERILIDSSDPEFNQSSFVWVRETGGATGVEKVSIKKNAPAKEWSPLNVTEGHSYGMHYELEGKNYFLKFYFAAEPKLFNKIYQDQKIPPKQNFQSVSKGFFFLPSVEVLVSPRMGTLRMGSLSPTAKWKER